MYTVQYLNNLTYAVSLYHQFNWIQNDYRKHTSGCVYEGTSTKVYLGMEDPYEYEQHHSYSLGSKLNKREKVS